MITIRGIWSKGFTCIHLEKEIDPTLSYLPWMGSSPTKNLRFHVTLGRNSWRRWSSTDLKLSPALDWVEMGDFLEERVWGEGSSGREREEAEGGGWGRDLVREREGERFKWCGPNKTVDSGSTGQTGCPDRSDRSGPSWQKFCYFMVCGLNLELMTPITFN